MKKNLLFIFTLLSITVKAQTFSPIIRWQKCLGGKNADVPSCTVKTFNNGFITAGHTYSSDEDVTGYKGMADIWVVKQDAKGKIEWEKTFGGTADDDVSSIIQTKDGGYIFIGGTGSIDGDVTNNHGEFDVWAVKLSTAGSIEWQKTYGGSSGDAGHAIIETKDGGYAIAAETGSYDGDMSGNIFKGWFDYWVIKIDSVGTIQWQKNYGGSYVDVPRTIVETVDEGFIVGGYASTHQNNPTLDDGDIKGLHNKEDFDGWLIKISKTGNLEWQKCLGGQLEDRIYSIIKTKDKNYVALAYTASVDGDVTGNKGQYDYWVIKFDSLGTILWQKTYGGTLIDMATSIIEDNDGGLVVCGYSQSNDGQVTGNHGGYDYWLVKTNDMGDLQWQKIFGGTRDERAYSVLQTSKDVYVISGQSLSTNGDVKGQHGFDDYWIINVGPAITGISETAEKVNNLQLSPNPATGLVNVNYELAISSKVTLEIYDLVGRKISTVFSNKAMPAGTNNAQINLDDLGLVNGMYLIKTLVDDKVYVNKLVKEN